MTRHIWTDTGIVLATAAIAVAALANPPLLANALLTLHPITGGLAALILHAVI